MFGMPLGPALAISVPAVRQRILSQSPFCSLRLYGTQSLSTTNGSTTSLHLYGVWAIRKSWSYFSASLLDPEVDLSRTGYGYHADYMMGWPEDVLKQAMAQCTDQGGQVSSCPVVTARSEQDMNDCAQPNRVDEAIDGCELK